MRITVKVQRDIGKVSLIEKIISILSYLTMGIVGVIWFLIAYFSNKRLRYFFMYNIVQSMIIAIILTLIKLGLGIILSILAKIPILDFIAAVVYYIVSFSIIRLYPLGLAFSLFQIILFLLLAYIIAGVVIGRIFYVPFLSDFMNKAMKNYY